MMLGNTYAMKKLMASLVMMTAALTISIPVAVAEPTPAPPQGPAPAIEQFRIDRDAFLASMKARNQQINAINASFNRACESAKKDFKRAMQAAKTPDQKNLAATTRDTAITAAIVARDNAITLLGPEPTPPAEPMRISKMQSKSKQR
ncbi:MAG: hypothetical protein ACKOXI_00715 [Candidatus Planktophila sp.]